MDIRALISAYVQGLRFLCEISQTFVNLTMEDVLDGFIYTPTVLRTWIIESQVQQQINHIVISAPSIASNSISLFSYAVGSQLFINALGTNAMVYISPEFNNSIFISTNTYQMEDGSLCTCLPAVSCTAPAAIYWENRTRSHGTLPMNMSKTLIKGMKTDCYPSDGLKASTLECFFDKSCLQVLFGNVSSPQPLNASLPSSYSSTDTVDKLFGSLFMEKFTFAFSLEAYYGKCNPQVCIYSYSHENPPLTVMTTMIGIVSGLDTALRFLLPALISGFLKIKKKFHKSIENEPQASDISTNPGNQKMYLG